MEEELGKIVLVSTPRGENNFYDLFKKYSKELETPNKLLENNSIIIEEKEDSGKEIWKEL